MDFNILMIFRDDEMQTFKIWIKPGQQLPVSVPSQAKYTKSKKL